jgi:DNA-binding SARP family transcriptional activator/predicted ATPase
VRQPSRRFGAANYDVDVRVRILGGIAVVGDERTQPVVPPRLRLVLAVLAARAGTVVDDDTFADAIWGADPPRSQRTAIQTYVSAVRDLLEPGRPRRSDGAFVRREGTGYVLAEDALDASRFECLVARAHEVHATDAEAAIALLAEAHALWADPPFAEFADAPWAIGRTTRLRDLHGASLEARFGLALELGVESAAIAAMEAAAEAYPYRERLAGQLMLALYRAGQQQRALARYDATRRRLADDLGLDPGRELQLLERAIIAHDPALRARGRGEPLLDRPPMTTPSAVAPPRRLIGRSADTERVLEALHHARCVTIVGPGGVGKSSLAAVVARGAGERFGRLRHVDLAELGGRSVLRVIAETLRVVEHPLVPLTESIVDSIGDEALLMLIETCEVAPSEVAAAVSALLRAPGVVVLLTSQVPCGVPGERLVRLRALDRSSAIELLLLESGEGSESAALTAIADRVDRLPLGLELAAARIRTLGAAELLRQMDEGAGVLSATSTRPDRQRSVHAAVQWSVSLLDPDVRRDLERLSVLSAPFTLDVAALLHERVDPAGAGRGPVEHVAELVDRSLLVRSDGEPTHFRVPDTVRAVVLASSAPDEFRRVRRTVAEIVVEAAQARLLGRPAVVSLEDLAGEVVAALQHLDETEDDRHLLLAGLLGVYFIEHGRISEGREHLARALERHPDGVALVRAMTGAQLGFLAWYQGDLIATRAALDDVVAMVPMLGDFGRVVDGCLAFVDRRYEAASSVLGDALDRLDHPTKQMMVVANLAGNAAWYAGGLAEAVRRYRRQRDAARELDDRFNLAQALRFEAMVTAQLGDPEGAWRLAERSRTMAEEMADPVSLAQSLAACAAVAHAVGAHREARADALAAIDASRRHFDVFGLRTAVPILAIDDLRLGSTERAARLLGWYLDLLDRTGQAPSPAASEAASLAIARARSELGPVEFARAAAAGAGRRLVELVHDG